MWSARAGRTSRSARRCWPRPSRSSGRCTRASRRAGPASTSGSTRPRSGTCRTPRCRWPSRCPANRRSRGSPPLADHLIAVEPDAELVSGWDAARSGRAASRKIGQIPICWGPDRDRAIRRAHELFRWFGGGWHVNADLPTPVAFEAASQFVRTEDVADSIACGPDLDELVESVRPFWDAGFTDVALVQIGDESQGEFLESVAEPLLGKLRAAAPAG